MVTPPTKTNVVRAAATATQRHPNHLVRAAGTGRKRRLVLRHQVASAVRSPRTHPSPAKTYSDDRPDITTPVGASRGSRVNGQMTATQVATAMAGRRRWVHAK